MTSTQNAQLSRDRWATIALPILQHVAAVEGVQDQVTVEELSEATGASPQAIEVEVDRLREEGLLGGGEFAKFMTGGDPSPYVLMLPRLTGAGCRVVGTWPSESFGDALLEMLSQAAEEAEPEQSSKFHKVLGAIKEVGVSVFTEVAASAVKQSTGLG